MTSIHTLNKLIGKFLVKTTEQLCKEFEVDKAYDKTKKKVAEKSKEVYKKCKERIKENGK